jgi:hypothetical protein
MPERAQRCACEGNCLREVLLGYLQAEGALPWPGADGLSVDEVLAAYPAAARGGRVPGQAELERRHPGLKAEVRAFFAGGGTGRRLARCRQGVGQLPP